MHFFVDEVRSPSSLCFLFLSSSWFLVGFPSAKPYGFSKNFEQKTSMYRTVVCCGEWSGKAIVRNFSTFGTSKRWCVLHMETCTRALSFRVLIQRFYPDKVLISNLHEQFNFYNLIKFRDICAQHTVQVWQYIHVLTIFGSSGGNSSFWKWKMAL